MRTVRCLKALGLLVFSLALVGCSLLPGASPAAPTPTLGPIAPDPNVVIVEGRLVPRDSASLFFALGGRVEEVLVQEGDRVVGGQVLARLGDREQFEAVLAAARLELLGAEQQLKTLTDTAGLRAAQAGLDVTAAEREHLDTLERLARLDTTDYADQIDDAQVKVNDLEQVLEDAQKEFDKYAGVDPDNADRKDAQDTLQTAQDDYDQAVRDRDRLVNALDQARAAVSLAEARLEDARRVRDERQPGPDPDDLALAEARLANARAQVAAAEAALINLELKAPFAGTLVKVDIAAGERAVPNQPVMVLADFSAWYVETSDLTENEVVRIETGQTATVVPDVLPDMELTAVVESIAEFYTEKAGDVLYRTRLRLEQPEPELRWGLTVEVRLEGSRR